MDNNIVLTPNLWWSSVTECFHSSIKQRYNTEELKSNFLPSVGGWYFGGANIRNYDKCINGVSQAADVYLGEWGDYLFGDTDSETINISEYTFWDSLTYDDDTRIDMLYDGLSTSAQLVTYKDLEYKPVVTLGIFANNWQIKIQASSTIPSTSYVYLSLGFYSSSEGVIHPFIYQRFAGNNMIWSRNTIFNVLYDKIFLDNTTFDELYFSFQFHNLSGTVVQCSLQIPAFDIYHNMSVNQSDISSNRQDYNAYLPAGDVIERLKEYDDLDVNLTFAWQKNPEGKTTVNCFGGQWQASSKNPDTSKYLAFESISNKGVDNSYASLYLIISGYSEYSFYIRSNGESCCDYVMVSQLDENITSATSTGSTIYVKAHTASKGTSGIALTNHTKVTFSNISAGQKQIHVIYRKDSSVSKYDDQGFILVPKPADVIGTTSYYSAVTANCNNEWGLYADTYNPQPASYQGFVSMSNIKKDNSYASLILTFSANTTIPSYSFYIRSYGENRYDYVMVSQLNQNVTSATSSADTTLVKAVTMGSATSVTALTGYKLVTFTNIPAGKNTVQIIYRKDSSQSGGTDQGYVLLPKPITIQNTYSGSGGGGTGGDVERNARLYWEDFQFVGCTGARINLDDYYMTPIVNEGVDIYSDYSFSVTHATRAPFSAGTDSNGAYIDIPKTSLSDFERSENCFVGVKFATSNNIGSPYNSMWVLFPVTITGSKNIITGEWDEEGMQARVWLEEGRMEFSNLTTYEAGFDISHCYEGETQVFVEPNSDGEYYFMYGFCDKIYIAAIGDTYTRAYGIAGVSDYNVSTSFYGASSVRLMPSNISNITNIFYWHQYTVQRKNCRYKIQNG